MSTALPNTGRSNMTGPVNGAYNTIVLNPFAASATPGAVTTTFRLSLPQACRVMEIGIGTNSSAGGASRPTMQITDGTNNLLSGAVTFVSAGAVTVTPTSSPSLVAAQRSRAKGDILQFQITTVAAEAVAGCSISVALWVRDHVVALADND